ncbi:fumarylacetoacetate hydrolase family protein [Paraburkholderia elongata]|uniref:Fumarylacetoacetate hydrolase n=1 Tax=Paraburkholderia elongata TaxID=2675747 RepID=A0A972SMN2_9BURK|nr:fumarylacetoacetate hydrolase family protein [Paraburkholderia elongata]NPT60357.1 fumarylacetoacetate hydrolase [Paraburkholderia elongata]
MAESLLRYQDAGSFRWGRLVGDAPRGASDTIEVAPLLTNAQKTSELLNALSSGTVHEEPPFRLPASSLLSPVTSDGQLVCQGLNYAEHSGESGHHLRRQNLFFMKASSSLTGPYADIVRPREVELLDYEVEIGVVMRRAVTGACEVTDETIGDYVAGVVLCNDVSARDTMFGASFLQWFQGKSYRGFCPAGPILLALDPDEVAETLNALEITLDWGNTQRQSARSDQLIFRPAETITQLSEIMDLAPGDMILTGTPGGVLAKGSPKVVDILAAHLMADETRRDALRAEMTARTTFLQPGDVLRLTMRDTRSGKLIGGQETRIV